MSGDVLLNASVAAMGGAAAGGALGVMLGLAARKRRVADSLALVCIAGPAAGRRVRLNGAALCIGRAPGCDIQLDDAHVSRRHASLIPGANGASLRDLGSSAGIWIDGARVFDAALQPGDQFQIGAHVFVLQQRADAPASPRQHIPAAVRSRLAGDGLTDIELGDVLHAGAHFTIVRARASVQPARALVVKFLNLDGASDARVRARFGRYLRQAMCVDHPHVAAVLGGSASAQPPFVVEAYAAGGSLAARAASPLSAGEASQVLHEVCEALAHLHAQGIAHGALTPGDVLFGEDNCVWLANAGLARVQATVDQSERERMRADVRAFADLAQSLLGVPFDVRDVTDTADTAHLLAKWRSQLGTASSGLPEFLQAAGAQLSGFRPLRLRVLATQHIVAVSGNPFLLGRALNPADRSLSRLHAELRFDANRWQVVALPGSGADGLSLNGVPVNGAQVVAVGDELLLGATAVRIVE